MAKLSACMEIVNSMSEADQDDLLTRLDSYIADGVPPEQAQKMAAQDALEELIAEQAEFSRLLREQHPDLFNATIPEDQDVDPDMPDVRMSAQRQTDTPEFKRWFGDSKVVDENGEPLVVYHGTKGDFSIFDASRIGSAMGNTGFLGAGFYFTNNDFMASGYSGGRTGIGDGSNVMPVYLSLQNPLNLTGRLGQDVIDALKKALPKEVDIEFRPGRDYYPDTVQDAISLAVSANPAVGTKITERLQELGYDGVIFDGGYEIVAFRPEQIKSATGNRGTFDPENPDIRMSAQRDRLGFISALTQGIDSINAKSQPAAGWKAQIKGMVSKGAVKADEVEWSGINDWLDLQEGKVSKEAVLEYLEQGGVRVEEVVLGKPRGFGVFDGNNKLVRDGFETRIEALDWADENEIDGYAVRGENDRPPRDGFPGMPKFGQYTLPGGENYREVLLTLPRTMRGVDAIRFEELNRLIDEKTGPESGYGDLPDDERRALRAEVKPLRDERTSLERKKIDYKSKHWDQPNVLVHMRVDDRMDDEGNRVLFVQEIQSDWGQQGREEGFNKPPMKGEVRPQEGYDPVAADSWEAEDGPRRPWAVYWEDGSYSGGFNTREQAEYHLRTAAQQKAGGVPLAPFIGKTDGWLNLALKRIMVMAAEGGYDKVAFTTGEQNADRFGLDKQVDRVELLEGGEYDVLHAYKNGEKVIVEKVSKGKDLSDYVGKEVAEKLRAAPVTGQSAGGKTIRGLEGVDLKVGGTGMRAFYDQIVPLALKKLLPRVGGGQMTTVSIPDPEGTGRTMETRDPMTGERRTMNIDDEAALEQPGFTITDAMREKVDAGLPLFSVQRNRQPTIGRRFNLAGISNVDAARIKIQDEALRLRRVQEMVKEQGGTVGEAQDFYLANTLMPGRVQAMMDQFRDEAIQPMIKKAAKADISMDELALYAYAKHAEERNNYIASINNRFPDGGSGMKTADAQAIIQRVESGPNAQAFKDLHSDLMAITATTRLILLQEGLITQEQYDAWENSYQNYIPLRGFENMVEETGAVRPGVGRGINVRGEESIRALGRASKAGDLIENVIRDYQRAVVRAERNNVGKVLLDFVLTNPDSDLWQVDATTTRQAFDKSAGVVRLTKSIDKGDDTIGIKVGGVPVYIKIQDPGMLRALRQVWKEEIGDLEKASVMLTGWYTAWMRNVLTRYNPIFAAVNIVRDVQSGMMATLDDIGWTGMLRFTLHYGKALAASAKQDLGLNKNKTKMDRLFNEFKANGGITGGFYMRDVQDIAQQIQNDLLLAGASGSGMRGVKAKVISKPGMRHLYRAALGMARILEFTGSASENATRFAMYMAARDSGKTPAQSARLAKDGTTNFNRRGEIGGTLNAWYLFFNAAVQSNAQLFKTLKNPKVSGTLFGIAAATVGLAAFNAAAGGEDDDGELYWDKIPDYEKERNLIIMLEPGETIGAGITRVGQRGRYIKIPLQYGLNFFPNMGYMVEAAYRNQRDPKQGKPMSKAAAHMASTFFGSINPFGGALDVTDAVQLGMAAAPTIIDPIIQLATERNAFGTPVAPAKMPGDTTPDSERMYASQIGTVSEKLAKAINELGGGDQVKPGKIAGIETSITPGTIDNLIRNTTGGLGMFVTQMAEATMAAGEEGTQMQTNRMPFLNRFYGEVGESQNIRNAQERMAEVRTVSEQVKDYIKLGVDPNMTDDEKRLISLAQAEEAIRKQMARLRKEEVQVLRDPNLSETDKKLARENILAARDRLASDFNKAYRESLGVETSQ